MFLGNTSRTGTSSNARHYELSSVGRNKTHGSRNLTSVVGGGSRTTKANDSEDELVKEERSISAPIDHEEKGGIRVNTTYQVFQGDEESARGKDRF